MIHWSMLTDSFLVIKIPFVYLSEILNPHLDITDIIPRYQEEAYSPFALLFTEKLDTNPRF